MITTDDFLAIKDAVAAMPEQLNGLPLSDHITWSETAGPPESAKEFALEAIYVICNSGMKHTVARGIYERIRAQTEGGAFDAHRVFGHVGKAQAINEIWDRQKELFAAYMRANDKVAFCATLPWIGEITKFHLAKNFGADVAKPDVHLQRLARLDGSTPEILCDRLAAATGYKARTIDLILWMACAKGVIDSATGRLRGAA